MRIEQQLPATVLIAVILACVSFPVLPQHLPSTPGACGGNICVEAGPLLDEDSLIEPSVRSEVALKRHGATMMVVDYKQAGTVTLALNLSDKPCLAAEKSSKANYGGHAERSLRWNTCGDMPNHWGVYRLTVTWTASNAEKLENLCMQGMGDIWLFEPANISMPTMQTLSKKLVLPRCH